MVSVLTRKRERLHLSRWVHGIRRLPCRFFRRPLATIHAPCPVACRASLFYIHWCHYQRRQSLCLAVFTLVKHPRTMVWWQHHSLRLTERCIDSVSFDEKWILMVGLSLCVGFYGRWKLLWNFLYWLWWKFHSMDMVTNLLIIVFYKGTCFTQLRIDQERCMWKLNKWTNPQWKSLWGSS